MSHLYEFHRRATLKQQIKFSIRRHIEHFLAISYQLQHLLRIYTQRLNSLLLLGRGGPSKKLEKLKYIQYVMNHKRFDHMFEYLLESKVL